jgi:hypothetical protein
MGSAAKMVKARPLSEWHEDIGCVVWWKFPLAEAPYIGCPLDVGMTVEVEVRYYEQCQLRTVIQRHQVGGWPGYHTHWTPVPDPPEEPE